MKFNKLSEEQKIKVMLSSALHGVINSYNLMIHPNLINERYELHDMINWTCDYLNMPSFKVNMEYPIADDAEAKQQIRSHTSSPDSCLLEKNSPTTQQPCTESNPQDD